MNNDPYKDTTGGYSAPGHGPYGPSAPYGAMPYGPVPGHGPVPPYPSPPAGPEHGGRAVAALVLSCVQVFLCGGLTAIPGIVFSALALGEKYDPERRNRMTRNAWLSVWINFGLFALLALVIVGYTVLVVTSVS